ncbi:hypothetical protein N7535_004988 [Penicillium sp. DV-2018c]|nr:hypothetical protein N7461_008569 [Penicillium sp. DV-2018c]KAJ5571328.1 hypothetical protein N7535_004988 [Penicillium sp. DV-2018c]
MYSDEQHSKSMYSTASYISSHTEPFEAQHTESLTDMPINAPMNSHMSSLQDITYLDTQLDPRSFLTPGDYCTSRRGSTVGSTVDSQYAWSTTSNADMLSNSPNLSSFDPINPGTSTPLMQSYPPSESLRQIIPSLNDSGYTTQQIDKWCIDSNPTEDFYNNPRPQQAQTQAQTQTQFYQTMGPMSFTPEIQPEPYTLTNLPQNTQWLSPEPFFQSTQPIQPQTERPISTASSPAHSHSISISDQDPDSPPQSTSASNADLTLYGIPSEDGTWRCAYPGCTSQASFRRGCDLRKHYNRHRKYLSCRYEGCPQSVRSGFSSKKDRARHEAKHNPGVLCEWEGCGKVFSRVDNMKDHVRRIHRKGEVGRG